MNVLIKYILLLLILRIKLSFQKFMAFTFTFDLNKQQQLIEHLFSLII